MILEGLPKEYKTFTTVIIQKDTPMMFLNFKTALRNFEEVEKTEDNIPVTAVGQRCSDPKNTTKPDLMEHVFLTENMDTNPKIVKSTHVKSRHTGARTVKIQCMRQSFTEK